MEALRVADAAVLVGMGLRARRWGPCPACGAARTKTDARPPVSVVGAGKGWWCHACDRTGDAIDLASWAAIGRSGAEAGSDFRAVLEVLRGLRQVNVSAAEEEVKRPDGIADALRACEPLATQPGFGAYLRGRGIDPDRAPCRVLPVHFEAPWWPKPWSSTWRLVVPAFSGTGELLSLQARACVPLDENQPKCRWPRGVSAGGLLFADSEFARPLLRGLPSAATRVLIVEGLTDYLTAVSTTTGTAVIGIASGSAAALRLLKTDLPVIVATDYDRQGAVYAAMVAEAMAPHPVRPFAWCSNFKEA